MASSDNNSFLLSLLGKVNESTPTQPKPPRSVPSSATAAPWMSNDPIAIMSNTNTTTTPRSSSTRCKPTIKQSNQSQPHSINNHGSAGAMNSQHDDLMHHTIKSDREGSPVLTSATTSTAHSTPTRTPPLSTQPSDKNSSLNNNHDFLANLLDNLASSSQSRPAGPPLPSQRLSTLEGSKASRKRSTSQAGRKRKHQRVVEEKPPSEDDMDFDSLLKAHESAQEKKMNSQSKPQQHQDQQWHRPNNHTDKKRKSNQSSNLENTNQHRADNMTTGTPADLLAIANEVLGRDPKRQKMLQGIYQQHSRPTSSSSGVNGTTTATKTTTRQANQRIKRHPGQEKRKEGTTPPDKRLPCRYFKVGKCKEGNKCRFQHDGESFRMVCRHFKLGLCNKGDECNFIHDLSCEPCRFYHVTGKCDTGTNCPFSHQPLDSELRKRLHALTGPCKYYHLKGFCTNGEKCLFSHAEITTRMLEDLKAATGASEVQQAKPCTFYHLRGYCTNEDQCKFSHAPITQEQRIKLQQLLNQGTPQ